MTNEDRINAWYKRAARHLAKKLPHRTQAWLNGTYTVGYLRLTERQLVQRYWRQYR